MMGTILMLGMASLTAAHWTILISVFALCLTALGIGVKVFSKKARQADLLRLEKENEVYKVKHEALKDTVGEITITVATLTERSRNNEKTIGEMKEDNRAIGEKIEYLLKELVKYLN